MQLEKRQIMRRTTRALALALLLAVAAARSPVFDDDDEDSGGGRNDQHVATVPLEHSFGVRSIAPLPLSPFLLRRAQRAGSQRARVLSTAVHEESLLKVHPCVQGGEYTARGTLTYTGPKLVTSKSKRLVSVQIEQSKFSSQDLAKLQQLVEDGKPYRIRIQVGRLSLFLLHFCNSARQRQRGLVYCPGQRADIGRLPLPVRCGQCKLCQGDGINSGMPPACLKLPRDRQSARGPVRTHSRSLVSDYGHRVPQDQASDALRARAAGVICFYDRALACCILPSSFAILGWRGRAGG